ncbi:MAG: DUF4404 family protein [Anaerolineae bacterium]|nr:DUF4404 family protein [Anaerolineae bacterium]MBN8620262.1 DUF4404 family protein [Anaerolineae bacterium]
MDDKQKRTLQTLQRELQSAQVANETSKARIEELNHEIERVIGQPGEGLNLQVDLSHGLGLSLQRAIDDLEGHHPQLAEAIRIAINTLVNAGI